jgi:exodeoxyribonuclease V beta subunit
VSSLLRFPRPEILDRIDLDRHAVIEASAGTGKTYALEHIVVELALERGIALEQILVVTFTDKATREMRERVRAKLRAIADATVSAEGSGGAWEIDDAKRRRLHDAIAVFDRAPISTIHSFCQRILTESAFDCARLLRQEQVESREVFAQAFREELRHALAEGAPLREILASTLRTAKVDRLEEALYRWYAERGAPEPRFDRDLAREALCAMPTRFELGPNGMASRLLAQAFSHPSPKKEVPARLWELASIVERVQSGGSIYAALLDYWAWAEGDAPSDMRTIGYLVHHTRQASKKKGGSIGPLADRIERLSRALGSPLTVLVAELLPRIAMRSSDVKSERGHFDFDDMLRMLRDALHAPGSDALVGELRRRYRVALVDEFQDTDRVQWDIFRRIFFHEDQKLIVIGDPKQAIYGFRNADVHTYHAARAEIEAAGSIVPLTVNYRSREPLVRAVNRVLEKDFFSGTNSYPHPVVCGRPALTARDSNGRALPAITLLHFVGRPELRADLVRTALGDRIALEIERLLETVRVASESGERPLAPSDIHVLCRSRHDADGIGQALARARIPHAFYKQEGLFQTDAARHVWVILAALLSPDDRGRRLDAWLTPFFAVPLERLDECRDLPPEHPLVWQLYEWRAMADAEKWPALFRSILEDSGLVRRELFTGSNERRLTDYQHIFEVLLEESHRGGRSLAQLAMRLSAFIEGRESVPGESGNVQRLESERRAVQILTMHKAKGLEAHVVFLVGGWSEPQSDRFAPHVFHDADGRRVAWIGEPNEQVRELMARERREEAERLLYVALTRAKSALIVPYFGPPPRGAEIADASYELAIEPEEAREEPKRAQLSLFFEGAVEEVVEEPAQYELKRMSGPYRVLKDRLRALVAEGALDQSELFSRIEVNVSAPRAQEPDERAMYARIAPVDAPGETIDRERYARLARARSGFEITSYTKMKNAAARQAELEEDTWHVESNDAPLAPVREDELPGGSSIGVFLHEVLEHLAPASLLEAADGAALVAKEGVLFERCARRNGIDAALLVAAADLIVRAMRTEVSLADGARLALASAVRCARELSFLHPIPERGAPWLGSVPSERGFAIERGFVRGIVDLVIEHEGRFHIVDYKSDRLASYEPEIVAAHVERNYLVQARLYALGTLRALGIREREAYEARFGGLLYAFLRGMGEPGQGVWTLRPSFDEVVAWERALENDTAWGARLPPRRTIA